MNINNDQLLSLDELRDLWNAQADAANSWDSLGADEIAWWAQRQALALAGLLADGPAVPQVGREPASVVGEPSDEELRAVWCDGWNTSEEWGALNFARAVLARWGHQPAPPAEGEVAELVAWLRGANWDSKRQTLATRAADLLEQCHPAPVPPAEGEVAELIEELRMIRVDVAPCDSDVITRAADLLEQLSSGWVVPTVEQLAPVPEEEPPHPAMLNLTYMEMLSVERQRLRALFTAEVERQRLRALFTAEVERQRLRALLPAADLLEQRHPAPVPVAERLPGPEDCDGEGRC